MKLIITLSLAFLLILLNFELIFGQQFKSDRQSAFIEYSPEQTNFSGLKTIWIDGEKIKAELPTGGIFEGVIKFHSKHSSAGKEGELYNINAPGEYEDEIFLNLSSNMDGLAVTYYLINYQELTEEQKAIQKKETEEYEYKSNLELYGKLTADCVRDKQVKVGMNYMGVFAILGEPISRNTTQTANSISQQFVYPNMYIYTEFDKVTAIQTKE